MVKSSFLGANSASPLQEYFVSGQKFPGRAIHISLPGPTWFGVTAVKYYDVHAPFGVPKSAAQKGSSEVSLLELLANRGSLQGLTTYAKMD